jgi:uncharacterized radical SAM superfamily protein
MSTIPSRTHWTAETLNQALADPHGPFKRGCKIGLNSVAWSVVLPSDSRFKDIDITSYYTLATIAAWLRSVRPDIRIVYSNDVDQLLECDHVWSTAGSHGWNNVNKLGKIVVEAGKEFVVGGSHATALPESLKYGRAFRGPIEVYAHIDELPLPDWSIFPETRPPAMMTSRGCPFSCNFCSSKNLWKRYQFKSPENVIAEAKLVRDLGVSDIAIFDDLFVANKKRLRRIVELMKAEGLNRNSYHCYVRSDLIDLETSLLLKDMNVSEVHIGAESGSDRMLRLMNKGTTVAINQRAIDLLYEHGIQPTMTLILGYPDETEEDMNLTIDFVSKNRAKCNNIVVVRCVPLPGTPLWDGFVREYDIDIHAFDWDALKLGTVSKDGREYTMLTWNYPEELLMTVLQWNAREEDEKHKTVPAKRRSLPRRLASKIKRTAAGVLNGQR